MGKKTTPQNHSLAIPRHPECSTRFVYSGHGRAATLGRARLRLEPPLFLPRRRREAARVSERGEGFGDPGPKGKAGGTGSLDLGCGEKWCGVRRAYSNCPIAAQIYDCPSV